MMRDFIEPNWVDSFSIFSETFLRISLFEETVSIFTPSSVCDLAIDRDRSLFHSFKIPTWVWIPSQRTLTVSRDPVLFRISSVGLEYILMRGIDTSHLPNQFGTELSFDFSQKLCFHSLETLSNCRFNVTS